VTQKDAHASRQMRTSHGCDIRVGTASTYLDGSVYLALVPNFRYTEIILSPDDVKELRDLLKPPRWWHRRKAKR
jgi:hypothetical protein